MLLMSGLLYATHWFLYSAVASSFSDNFKLALNYVRDVLFVLLPACDRLGS